MKTLLLAFALTTAANAAETITPDNVHRLRVAWTYDTRDSTRPVGGIGKAPAFEATPVYDSGRLYLSTPQGTVTALDAESGRELWRVELVMRKPASYSDPANRGPTLRGNRLYIGTIDARLICLQASNGQRCRKFGNNGEVNLMLGLRRSPKWPGEYGVTSPPTVIRDVVVVGSSIADNSRAIMASGEVRAFDAVTGELRWTFHPLSKDVAAGGANAWAPMAADKSRGLVYLSTGSPSPDYFGGLRSGNNDYANSIVVLDAKTGKVKWHFQTVHHDLWDYDVASPPLLFSYPRARSVVPAVAVGSKTGHIFLFDRITGKPLFPIEERPVPASDVPGESASPTQPYPSKPMSLVPQRVTEDDIRGATPEDREACLQVFRSLRHEGAFTPPSIQGSFVAPGNVGGLHWGGMTYDARDRLLIAPVNRFPSIVRLVPRADFAAARKAFPSRETTEQDGAPYSMSREFFWAPSGAPCLAPPWGELVAVRVDDGAIAWRVPLGDLRGLSIESINSTNYSQPTGSPNLGGAVITSGLLFIGATLDPALRAFDARNGKELWSARLPTSARATPLVFTSKRQMVVIAAGGHDHPTSRIDTKLVAFALD